MVSVLSGAESEALIVRSILEASNIPATVEGAAMLPEAYRLSGYEVMVPEEFESEARRIIADAVAGVDAAETPTEY
jgi:hypothetical protein